MESKKWYHSRTMWLNLIAIAAIFAQWATGHQVIDVEGQAAILAVVNLILRAITNQGLAK